MGSRFMDEFDGDIFSDAFWPVQKTFFEVPLDVKESPGGFDLELDLPGAKKEDITVELQDRVLTVCAESKGMDKEEGEVFRRIECFRGHISRSITLPEEFDPELITADYTDGVLHVKLPKALDTEPVPAREIVVE
jgi:HSP20 family protein